MWVEYLELLNVGKHLFKFSGRCPPYDSKLKREADSPEVDIQIFIIKPVTFSKNVFMGSVANNL